MCHLWFNPQTWKSSSIFLQEAVVEKLYIIACSQLCRHHILLAQGALIALKHVYKVKRTNEQITINHNYNHYIDIHSIEQIKASHSFIPLGYGINKTTLQNRVRTP